MKRGLLLLALVLGSARAAPALPLISELFYDATGSDAGFVFVELYGPPGTSLEGYSLAGINGSDGGVTQTVALMGAIAEDGLFVVASDDGAGSTAVSDFDLIADFDFQNGPDSVQLLDPDGAVVDALGYGVFAAGDVFAGEGAAAPDPSAGSSLARLLANVDTDDNALDFEVLEVPTPGDAVLDPVPEPATGLLLPVGLLLLGLRRSVAAG